MKLLVVLLGIVPVALALNHRTPPKVLVYEVNDNKVDDPQLKFIKTLDPRDVALSLLEETNSKTSRLDRIRHRINSNKNRYQNKDNRYNEKSNNGYQMNPGDDDDDDNNGENFKGLQILTAPIMGNRDKNSNRNKRNRKQERLNLIQRLQGLVTRLQELEKDDFENQQTADQPNSDLLERLLVNGKIPLRTAGGEAFAIPLNLLDLRK